MVFRASPGSDHSGHPGCNYEFGTIIVRRPDHNLQSRGASKRAAHLKSHGDFYAFFSQWPVDHHSAISAVVAASVGGALLTLTLLTGAALSWLEGNWTSSRGMIAFALSLCAAVATYGTWKRVMSGAIAGGILGLAVTTWLLNRHELALAAIVFLPFVGSFVIATRGMYFLNHWRARSCRR